MKVCVSILSVFAFLLGAPLYAPHTGSMPSIPQPRKPQQQSQTGMMNAGYQGEK